MSKPLNKSFRPAATNKERTPKNKLGQIVNQTFEEEHAYLNLRLGDRSKRQDKCYLPSPEQIAEHAAIIREENYELDRLNREVIRAEYQTPAAIYSPYTLDIAGMGSRRGKLI